MFSINFRRTCLVVLVAVSSSPPHVFNGLWNGLELVHLERKSGAFVPVLQTVKSEPSIFLRHDVEFGFISFYYFYWILYTAIKQFNLVAIIQCLL